VPIESPTAMREERVLTLLHLLGDEAAEEVFGCLDSDLAARLRRQLEPFSENPPSTRRQQQVLDEFDRFFRFAVSTSPRKLRMHVPDDDDDEEEEELPRPKKVYQPKGDPLADLEKMNVYQLARALNEEQPRTVALLLNVISVQRTAELLSLFPEDRRDRIAREIASDPQAPELILRKIADTTVHRATTFPAEPPKENDPVQRMADVLRATEKPKRREILQAIEEQDADRAARIQQALYKFEDLAELDDHQIQQILSRVDSSTLSTALFDADQKILDKVFKNLSKRARASLEEEIGFQRHVPGPQLNAARELLVRAIAEVEQEAE
jgi:flagellar motor switch protein FliG